MSKQQNEMERSAAFEGVRQRMRWQGYREYICTISIVKANVLAIILGFPFILLFLAVYLLMDNGIEIDLTTMLWFMLLLLASFPIHEGLHGIVWRLFCKQGWRSIHFGMMWRYLTPYCHCREPLGFGGYLLGGLMPLLLLGIGLFLLSLCLHSTLLLLLSLVNVIAAGGDMTITLMLLKHRRAIIYDHPTACGFIAFKQL